MNLSWAVRFSSAKTVSGQNSQNLSLFLFCAARNADEARRQADQAGDGGGQRHLRWLLHAERDGEPPSPHALAAAAPLAELSDGP